MRDAAWRALSYVAFLGLFTHFYGRGEVARHGRRGLTIFVWEVAAFLLFDILRLKLGWPIITFGPLVCGTALFKLILMVQAIKGGRVTRDVIGSNRS
jgi:hypothetical protein